MKVLYVDFDGVLQPEPVFWHPRRGTYLHPSLVADGHSLFEHAPLLEQLLEPYPDLRIVLSTSWVRQFRFLRTSKFLTPGLQARCVGATFHTRMDRREFDELLRGQQVLADVTRRRPSVWLALDDTDEGWHASQRDNVIITDMIQGIAEPTVLGRLTRALERFR